LGIAAQKIDAVMTRQAKITGRTRNFRGDGMDLGLRGRKALITGASKGIGRACAEALAEEGCDVALVSRTAADLETARAEIAGKYNVGVRVFPLDLSDSRNVDKVAAECADIDILVNNAGAIPGGNIDAITEDRWRTAWDLKVFGYINMTRRFYAQMRVRGHGVIVNVLGAAGQNPDFNYIAGSSGNASLMAFTLAMGGTSPRDNLRVVGINPGPVMTERLITLTKTRAKDTLGDEGRWEELMKGHAFGRAAKPEEIAWMVAFVASDRSAYTTGNIITIDGGGSSRRSAL
jgi:NAD(P)-dependent dehydrogenase (short-subunit alcohol dehydrogenase family)